jgi:hypothetical protein
MTVSEDVENRHLCPVALFLGLALADHVFKDIKTLSDLRQELSKPETRRDMPKHESILNDPVFLSSSSLKLGKRGPWTYAGMSNALRGLGRRAGYRSNVNSYCMRRASANAIHGR